MLPGWLLTLLCAVYVAMLFFIASYGDRRQNDPALTRFAGLVFALSIGVYATSWTFFGAAGTAARAGWNYLPIYLGPIIFFVFTWRLLERIIDISKAQNITSISDFIAARYGRSQSLAVLVTVIAVIGAIPYIALQLKAVATGYTVITSPGDGSSLQDAALDTAFLVAMALALFSILFGTRQLDATENHHGLILAIAFESLVKLLAFVAVGVFAMYGIFNGVGDVLNTLTTDKEFQTLFTDDNIRIGFFTQTLLAFLAMVCLPRQFQVAVVENTDRRHLTTARWVFPLYLIIVSILVIPIVLAGISHLNVPLASADQYMLLLPQSSGQHLLALLAFIGGFSAATGMVIVATVALSTMICNDIVVPLLMRTRWLGFEREGDLSKLLLRIRRVAIVAILLLSYSYFRYIISLETPLAQLGLISFVAAAQFAPAIIGGLLWKDANRLGALRGLMAGFVIWFYTLFVPTLARGGVVSEKLLTEGPAGIAWLKPEALLGATNVDPVSHAVFWSLLFNIGFYVFFSLTTRQSTVERAQAIAFTKPSGEGKASDASGLPWRSDATVYDLKRLIERFSGKEQRARFFIQQELQRAHRLLDTERADVELTRSCELQLASIIGASSARVVMTSALRGRGMIKEDVEAMLDKTTQVLSFNQDVLHATMENIYQGVSVVDSDLRLVAWNQQYLNLFDYPEGLVREGRHIKDLLVFNAQRGLMGGGDVNDSVERRLNYLRSGLEYNYERKRDDGRVLRMQGKPIPGGGFVTTYSDITEYKATEEALREANDSLERRVSERTSALTEVNQALIAAKQAAVVANKSKTQFVAAASHDLLQPLNAARLFAATLTQQTATDNSPNHEIATQIEHSLRAAEDLLDSLLDISKLDAGAVHVRHSVFSIGVLFESLATEFGAIASTKGLRFRCHMPKYAAFSDVHLVRRILQNYLSNAIRYTEKGGILLGCRYLRDSIRIDVVDTGIGIPEDKQNLVFEEFQRLGDSDTASRGMGLGLAITKRIATMLDTQVSVKSIVNRGSTFSLTLPRARSIAKSNSTAQNVVVEQGKLQGLSVLCIDNEIAILEGMKALLSSWGCEVTTAQAMSSALAAFDAEGSPPQLVIADYHLDEASTGIDVIQGLREQWNTEVPCIIITADYTDELRNRALSLGLSFMRKPIKPARFRALVSNLI